MSERARRSAAAQLNDRQRAYLLAVFTIDQELARETRSLPYRPFQPRLKAAEWRWLEYSEPVPKIRKPASRLYEAIKKAAPIDQGTGSTLRALADRGLIQVEEREYNVHGQPKPHIRLTPAGRRLARSWTGQQAYKAPPAGTLREWHWRALAQAYAAGDDGLAGEYGDYGRIGWNTWRRLLDYKWGALVTEGGLRRPYDHRLRITAAGRALYEREWAHRLSDAQLDGRACIRCGAENEPMRAINASSEISGSLAECIHTERCIERVSRARCQSAGAMPHD